MAKHGIVTFTTDFGLNEHFVGTMKGVVLNINPEANVVDICNTVQPYDILDGAMAISQAYKYFPADTIHVVVIDPGVGSTRRPIVVRTEKHTFVGPDNGVLSLVYDQEERISVRHITADHYFLQPVSTTFHGRDVFAAVAGWLSKGLELSKFGEEITDYVKFSFPKPRVASPTTLRGLVVKVDRFGNLITNITPAEAPQLFENGAKGFRIAVGKGEVARMLTNYSQGMPGEVFGILGSMGFLELSANRGAAAQILQVNKGTEIQIMFDSPVFEAKS